MCVCVCVCVVKTVEMNLCGHNLSSSFKLLPALILDCQA